MPISSAHETYEIKTKDENAINAIVESKRSLDPWMMVAETQEL